VVLTALFVMLWLHVQLLPLPDLAVVRHLGLDMDAVYQVKTPFTMLVLVGTVGMLVGQIWLWPLWRHRRQFLVRYVEPELVQLRYGLVTSWDALMEEAATEIDAAMAAAAWEKALRDACVYQHVYSIMFLVLDRRDSGTSCSFMSASGSRPGTSSWRTSSRL
jgi:hypothetical protein